MRILCSKLFTRREKKKVVRECVQFVQNCTPKPAREREWVEGAKMHTIFTVSTVFTSPHEGKAKQAVKVRYKDRREKARRM